MNTQKLTIDLPVIEGYEYTGEFRPATKDEYYLGSEWRAVKVITFTISSYPILRPIKKLRGPELFRAVINKIIASPSCWNQKVWESYCKTVFCFGGWVCQLAGVECRESTIQLAKLLEITDSEALLLAYSQCDFHTLYMFALSKYEKSETICRELNSFLEVSDTNNPSSYKLLV